MDETNVSLIREVGRNAPDAWARLDRVYRPFLVHWFRSRHVPAAEAEDLAQDVLLVLVKEMTGFSHSGRTGAFRAWLRGICRHKLLHHGRRQQLRGGAVGGTDFQLQVNAVEDADDAADEFDRQYDHAVLRQLFEELAAEFAPATMHAVRRMAFDGAAAADVAAELDLSVGAVYVAKSRVMRRLRELAAGLLDDTAIGHGHPTRPSGRHDRSSGA